VDYDEAHLTPLHMNNEQVINSSLLVLMPWTYFLLLANTATYSPPPCNYFTLNGSCINQSINQSINLFTVSHGSA